MQTLIPYQVNCWGRKPVVASTNEFSSDIYAPPAHLSKLSTIGLAIGWSAYGLIFLVSIITLTYFLVFRTNRYLNNKLKELRTIAVTTYRLDMDLLDGEFEEIWNMKGGHKREERQELIRAGKCDIYPGGRPKNGD